MDILIVSRSFHLRMENVSDKIIEKIKTLILRSVTFPPLPPARNSCCLWDNRENYCIAGQGTDDNMAHAHCMLDSQGCKHTLRICNTDCFSTATIAALNAPRCHVIRTLPLCLALVVVICSRCVWISFVIDTVLFKRCIKHITCEIRFCEHFCIPQCAVVTVCLQYSPVGS